MPTIQKKKKMGISSTVIRWRECLVIFINIKSEIVATINLRNVKVNGGTYGVDIFPAIKAPDQKRAARIIIK